MSAEQAALARTLLRCLAVLSLVGVLAWPALPCLCLALVLLVGADLFHPDITAED